MREEARSAAMGAGMTLDAASRFARGFSTARVMRHFVGRGLVLVAINLCVENDIWFLGSSTAAALVRGFDPPERLPFAVPGGGAPPFLVTSVLSGRGFSAGVRLPRAHARRRPRAAVDDVADRAAGVARAGPGLPVFGRTPLFFYFAHLLLFALIGLAIGPAGIGVPAMLPIWIGGVVALHPPCRWYDRFKRSTAPDSLWRLF